MLVELKDCDAEILNNVEIIRNTLVAAARRAKATIVEDRFHLFSPFGVSGVVVIAESHLTIHTWPEHKYAAVDVFTCGTALQPMVAVEYIIKQLKSKDPSIVEMKRGLSVTNPEPVPVLRDVLDGNLDGNKECYDGVEELHLVH